MFRLIALREKTPGKLFMFCRVLSATKVVVSQFPLRGMKKQITEADGRTFAARKSSTELIHPIILLVLSIYSVPIGIQVFNYHCD